LVEELPELPAGGLEGSLLLLRVAAMEDRPSIFDQIGHQFLYRSLSESGGVIELRDDLAA
jgi:hypothetical protein